MIDFHPVFDRYNFIGKPFQCTIPIRPYSKSNHLKFTNRGRAYIPKEYKQWDKEVKLHVRKAMDDQEIEIFTGPIHLHIDNYYPTKGVVDVINCFKSLGDALNGIVYHDDRQIVTCSAGKYYDKLNTRIEILVLQTDLHHDMVNIDGILQRLNDQKES